MKMRKKLSEVLVLAFVLAFMVPMIGKAAGTTTIHLSQDDISVGDKFSVEVTATEAGDISVKYNAEVLQLEGCSGEYKQEGNAVTFSADKATLEFSAATQGNSPIIVTSPSISGSSTVVRVAGEEDAEQQQSTEEQEPETQKTEEPAAEQKAEEKKEDNNTKSTEDGQFTVDGVAYVVSERFSDEEIPEGFEKIKINIDNYDYKALSDGTIKLVYLKPAADTSVRGTFYVYDEDKNQVSTFAMLEGTATTIMVSKPDAMLMEGMTETVLKIDGREFTVYQLEGESEFYFVYGTGADGNAAWYQLDVTYNTLQKVNQALLAKNDTQPEKEGVTEESTEETSTPDASLIEKYKQMRLIMAGLLFVIVVLVIVVINMVISQRNAGILNDEEDDYDEDNGEDSEVASEDEETEEVSENQEESIEDLDTEEVVDAVIKKQNKSLLKKKKVSEESAYEGMKGTEAFKTAKDTNYKAGGEGQIDILDLNDL